MDIDGDRQIDKDRYGSFSFRDVVIYLTSP